MIKNMLRVLLIAAALLALAFVGLVFLINPNQYQGAIEQAVFDSTGYELTIAGNLDLRFSPYFGLTLQDVRLRNPALPQELASTSEVTLRVDPALLLQGDLLISELRADDFHVNYFTDAAAVNNWTVRPASEDITGSSSTDDPARPAAASSGSASGPSSGSADNTSIRTSFERILLNNASVDVQDLSAGTRYNVRGLNLESRNVNFNGQTFPLELDFEFLNNGLSEPLAMGLSSNVTLSASADTLQLSEINFNLTPVLIQGQITVTGLNDALQFEGTLESSPFAVRDLLQTLSPPAVTSELPAVSVQPPVALALTFSGDQSQITLPSITAVLGTTVVQANANVRLATALQPTSISYELTSNALDLTPFLAASELQPTAQVAAAASDSLSGTATETALGSTPPASTPSLTTVEPADTALPLALINSFNLLGSISVESITSGHMVFDDVNIFTNLEDGVLDIESGPIAAFQGTIQGNARLDARNDIGDLSTQLAVNQIDLGAIAPAISRFNSIDGRLNVEANHNARGATVSELLDSVSGATQFDITENSVDIAVIKQVFTAISALSTSGEAIQQWPDVIQFQELSGYVLLENGIADNQQVKLRMDNFDITGTGGVDLTTDTFDYDLLFTVLGEAFVQTIQISPRYHDISWPVQCSSAFTDDVTQFCRPDFAQVREIFAQMGTNEVRRRLDDVVTDQVPQQLQDTTRGLLRNIFN